MAIDLFAHHFGMPACREKVFYNFGAGNWRHPYFQNIDIAHEKYPNNKPDIEYDAMSVTDLPIKDRSARVFYLSHVNEHLSDSVNFHIFRELHRCLVAGGFLRIVFPNFELAERAYWNNDRSFFLYNWDRGKSAVEARKNMSMEDLFIDFFATRATIGSPNDGNQKFSSKSFCELVAKSKSLEECAAIITSKLNMNVQRKNPGCHCNFWSFEKFRHLLQDIGFTTVQKSSYLQSCFPALRDKKYFDLTQPSISGYIDAVK